MTGGSVSDRSDACPHFPFPRRTVVDFPSSYSRLQDEDPVAEVSLPTGDRVHLVSRFEDARTILLDRDNVFSRSALTEPGAPWFSSLRPPPGVLTTSDAPHNNRLRRLVAGFFTTRRVRTLEPALQRITDSLLDAMEAGGSPADLGSALALPLPIIVICEVLGIPAERQHLVHSWCNSLITLTGDVPDTLLAEQAAMATYIVELVEERRARPTDDLLGTLVKALDEERLDLGELIMLIMFLSVAGHETTYSMINGSVITLLEHPEHIDRLLDEPDHATALIDELMRINPIGDAGPLAVLREDTVIGERTLPAGAAVLVPVGVANRDPRKFPDPHEFRPEREGNRDHLGFGLGAHSCLGAPLALAELRIVLTSLFRRFPGLALAVPREELRARPTSSLYMLESLPVTW